MTAPAPPPTPTVTISILVMDDTTRLGKCLQSVMKATLPEHTEIIVTGNGTPKTALDELQKTFPAVRIVGSEVNRGFAGGHMKAFAESTGELFLFLNDDVTVMPDWLEKLIGTISQDPRTAAVGSRLTFPDGKLQEAGMTIWQDGSTIPIGRGLPSSSLTYDYQREVDYCSACSLLVRRSALLEVGGMSDAYYPAYYEDADLALRFRQHGYRTLYEPQSIVIHEESKSTSNTKRHLLLERNREQFCDIWKSELLTYDPPPSRPEALPLANALVHAMWRARGYPLRACIAAEVMPNPGGTAAEAHLDSLLELLSHTCALTLALPPHLLGDIVNGTEQGSAVRRSCQNRGIQLLVGSLHRHISHPAVHYDIYIASSQSLLKHAFQAMQGSGSSLQTILDLRLNDGDQESCTDFRIPLTGLVCRNDSVAALQSVKSGAVITEADAEAWYTSLTSNPESRKSPMHHLHKSLTGQQDEDIPHHRLTTELSAVELRTKEVTLYKDLLDRAYCHATSRKHRMASPVPVLQYIPGLRSAFHALQRTRGTRLDPPYIEWEDRET